MITPHRAVLILRAITVCTILGLLVFTLGPFQGVESRAGLSDKSAHAIAFYVLTLMVFAVAPQWRRNDLALMTLGLGLLIELAQGLTGRSVSLMDFLADAVGVVAATAPGWIERIRYDARRHPYLSFSEISDRDRRKKGGRRQSPSSTGRTAANDRPIPKDGWR